MPNGHPKNGHTKSLYALDFGLDNKLKVLTLDMLLTTRREPTGALLRDTSVAPGAQCGMDSQTYAIFRSMYVDRSGCAVNLYKAVASAAFAANQEPMALVDSMLASEPGTS